MIILLCGFPCSGKDTVARYLTRYAYYPVSIYSQVNDLCSMLRGGGYAELQAGMWLLKKLHLSNDKLKEMLSSYRHTKRVGDKDLLLVEKVREDIKSIEPDMWRKDVESLIKGENGLDFVVTDCSNIGDLTYFKNAISIFIDANDINIYKRLVKRDSYYDIDILTREAEKEVPQLKEHCNFVVTNNGTLEDLYKKIDEVMEVIKNGKTKKC